MQWHLWQLVRFIEMRITAPAVQRTVFLYQITFPGVYQTNFVFIKPADYLILIGRNNVDLPAPFLFTQQLIFPHFTKLQLMWFKTLFYP